MMAILNAIGALIPPRIDQNKATILLMIGLDNMGYLIDNKLLDSYAIEILLNNTKYADVLAEGWIKLHRAGILTNESKQRLMYDPKGIDISAGVLALHNKGILTDSNLQELINMSANDRSFPAALKSFQEEGKLNCTYDFLRFIKDFIDEQNSSQVKPSKNKMA